MNGVPRLAHQLLSDRDATDARQVGHKFARQAELRRHGFPVPEFFCVPGAAFDAVVSGVDRTAAREPDQVAAAGAALRAQVAGLGVPPDLADEVLGRFDALFGADARVAVRACVVAGADGAGEDSAADPFAGMSDSFLYVGRADLLRRVVDCWASAFNPRALRYRLLRGHDPMAVTVAVGVQRMVPAARSFVAFSRDPVDGGPRCVIAAGYGVGEGVVQERADLDHFAVERDSGAVTSRLTVKRRMVDLDPARPDEGPLARTVAAELARTPVLTDAEATRIAELTAEVERYFGGVAQDVEGAITAAGDVLVVQARPAALAAAATGSEPAGDAPGDVSGPAGRQVAFTSANVTESFPGISGALTFSLAKRLCETVFSDYYRRMGVPAAVLRTNRYELERMLTHVRGRVHYRLDSWYHMHSLLPGFGHLRSTWEPAIGLRQAASPDAVPRSGGRLRRWWDAGTLAPRFAANRRRIHAALRWWDGYFAAELERGPRTPDQLIDDYHRLWAGVAERWGLPSVNNYHSLSAFRLVTVLTAAWAPGADRSVLTGMMTGGAESRSAAALRSAVELAQRVRSMPALRKAIAAGDARTVWHRVLGGEFGVEFADAAQMHVRRFGDRGPRDLKLETETVRVAPWTLLPTLAAYADQSLTVTGNREQEQAVRRAAEAELRAHCRGPLRRMVLRGLYRLVREGARLREDTRFGRSQIFGALRDILLALGADLTRAGLLDRPRDVLDLTEAELLGAYQGTAAGTELRRLVEARRAEREAWAAEPDPPQYFTVPAGAPLTRSPALARPPVPSTGDAGRQLRGIGSAPGRVRARARVVTDPEIDPQECEDRILIARETDPGWLFLMIAARGVVVENGSPLSHTAITARVLAIPTVVGVAGVTGIVRDGEWVELDGATGTVTRLGTGPDGTGPGGDVG